MKVSIDHKEHVAGLVFKKTFHDVILDVQFSDEELHIIKQRGLERDVVLKRGIPDNKDVEKYADIEDVFWLRISTLMNQKPDIYSFSRPVAAKEYELELVEALKELKPYISANEEVETKSTSFEL